MIQLTERDIESTVENNIPKINLKLMNAHEKLASCYSTLVQFHFPQLKDLLSELENLIEKSESMKKRLSGKTDFYPVFSRMADANYDITLEECSTGKNGELKSITLSAPRKEVKDMDDRNGRINHDSLSIDKKYRGDYVIYTYKYIYDHDKYRNNTSESMISIFESQKTFEKAFPDFKTIKTDFMLSRFLIKKLSPKRQKTGFIWQMQGNQIIPAIQDAIESFNDDTDYYIVRRDMSPQELASYTGSHLYTSKEEAAADETSGLIIIGEFTMMSPGMRNFIMDIVKGKNGYCLGANWRLVLTGNIHDGDDIWMPDFNDIFENVEWAPMPVSKLMYDDPDEEYESKKENPADNSDVSESISDGTEFMSIDEAKDKIYTILYNAAKKGEILPDEYIYIDEDGVIVDDESGFDVDTIKRARKADLFIDFDALEDGNVIIYTKPLYMFIEENIAR